MASLMFDSASFSVSPWLWQPGSAGQWTSKPCAVLLMTTVYLIRGVEQASPVESTFALVLIISPLGIRNGGRKSSSRVGEKFPRGALDAPLRPLYPLGMRGVSRRESVTSRAYSGGMV